MYFLKWCLIFDTYTHGLRTPREEKSFTARPKIHSHSQIFRYGRSIFCLPLRPNFSDIFDLCLHWLSVIVRAMAHYIKSLHLILGLALRKFNHPWLISKELFLQKRWPMSLSFQEDLAQEPWYLTQVKKFFLCCLPSYI